MYKMAHSLFDWLKRCCRKLPLTDQLRVGSGAGYKPAWRILPYISYDDDSDDDKEGLEASEVDPLSFADSAATDTDTINPIIVVPVLHTANAGRRTEHLATGGESSTDYLQPSQLANI